MSARYSCLLPPYGIGRSALGFALREGQHTQVCYGTPASCRSATAVVTRQQDRGQSALALFTGGWIYGPIQAVRRPGVGPTSAVGGISSCPFVGRSDRPATQVRAVASDLTNVSPS